MKALTHNIQQEREDQRDRSAQLFMWCIVVSMHQDDGIGASRLLRACNEIEWKKNDLPTLAQKVADDASETCQNFIYAGIDVELSDGTQHFSLMPNDQTNIDSMFAAITLGASEYPYHPDGGKCVMYSAADIITLYSEYKSFVTKQTTYCNALRQWAKRETDPNVIGSIYYGCTLPEDLEKEVEGILSAAQAQIVAIINKLSA